MDYLEEAKKDLDSSNRYWDSVSLYDSCDICIQSAIANALIALVERIDKLTDTDGLDDRRGFLRIDAG